MPLTALGSLRAESALTRIPFLGKLLPKIGDYFESAAARTAMRLTVWNGEQAGIQMVQAQLPYLMQDLGSAFSQAIPGVQWSNGKDGPLDGLWTKAGPSVITMLPFSILTGIHGLQRDASSRGFAEKPPLERSAYGFTAEAGAGEGLDHPKAMCHSYVCREPKPHHFSECGSFRHPAGRRG